MARAAQQVIDALAARLAPMAATGGRVYTDRAWPLDEAALPAWVLTLGEASVSPYTADGIDRHEQPVEARVFARAVSGLDDVLQALASTGQALLFAAPRPYGLQLAGDPMRLGGDAEDATGSLALQLRATFFARAGQPETILS